MGRAEDIFEKVRKEGEKSIDEFIKTKKSEELFLDFKRSANSGDSEVLDAKDRENLARAISGFGNSEGGVVIWGIDCSSDRNVGDVAQVKYPIRNVMRFVSWLEGAVSSCTVPPHDAVQNIGIASTSGDGFAITFIPKSNHAPHQVVISGKSQYGYLMRSGSNFSKVPHSVLAGMFGRRPQPDVYHMFTIAPPSIQDDKIKFNVEFLITNGGPGIAYDLFYNVTVASHPRGNSRITMQVVDPSKWDVASGFSIFWSAISKKDVRLAPDFFYEPFQMSIELAPPFDKDLKLKCLCGSGSSPVYKDELGNSREKIQEMYDRFLVVYRTGAYTDSFGYDFIKEVLNMHDEKISKRRP